MRGETVMRKLLRSCLGQTSWDRAACGAVALSGPVHSIWPVPHGSERATVTHTQHNTIISPAVCLTDEQNNLIDY